MYHGGGGGGGGRCSIDQKPPLIKRCNTRLTSICLTIWNRRDLLIYSNALNLVPNHGTRILSLVGYYGLVLLFGQISFYLGIEFYLFVSSRITKFTRGPSVASYLHEKQTSRIQSIYLYFNYFIKIVPFGYEISVFLIQKNRSLFYGRHYSPLHRLMSLHRKLNVKIFLMFIVAENTGSVNIVIWQIGPQVWLAILLRINYFNCS